MLGMVEIVSRRGKPIRSVKEWGVEAPPARALAGRPQREGTSKGLDQRQRLEALILSARPRPGDCWASYRECRRRDPDGIRSLAGGQAQPRSARDRPGKRAVIQ